MAVKSSFFKSDIFIMISIIFFLLLAIVILLAYNKNKIMETFKSTSDDDKKYRIEYYYMDGCRHCEDFSKSKVWDKLSSEYSNNIEFKKYNMKSCKDRIDKYEISGYPTIIIIDKRDSEKKLEEYNDERKYDIMKNFVEKYINM